MPTTVIEVGEKLVKSRVPEVKLFVELHYGRKEENTMKDFMGKRLVPEERVYENIHAKDGHEFFWVSCDKCLSLKRT